VTAHPTPRPDPGVGQQDGERMVRRFVTVLAVTVGGLCFLFSLGNVYQLAVDLELWAWIRPLVAPAVDLSLVALVVGIRFLARRGVSGKDLRRPRLFMLAVGLAAWALNTAHAVAERDWGKAAFDSLAPGLLIGWAEVLPWFLRQFQVVTHSAATPEPSQPVFVVTAPPPAGNHATIPAAALEPAGPAAAVPPAPVAVPSGSGNGHRPRPASTPGGDERAADARMRAHWGGRAGRRPDSQRGGAGPGLRPGSPQRGRPQGPRPLPAGRSRWPLPHPRSRSRSRQRAGRRSRSRSRPGVDRAVGRG
jgi:hypothetical protein